MGKDGLHIPLYYVK